MRTQKINVDEAARMYSEGHTLLDVAKRFDCAMRSVSRTLARQGVERRPTGRPPKAPTTQLGKLLQPARIKTGLSQREAAGYIGASDTWVQMLEAGAMKTFSLLLASRLAALLDIPLQDIADAAERDAQQKEAS